MRHLSSFLLYYKFSLVSDLFDGLFCTISVRAFHPDVGAMWLVLPSPLLRPLSPALINLFNL